MNYRGKHSILDCWLKNKISNYNIEKILEDSIRFANMNIVNKVIHNFEPHGKTIVYILAESHLTCHTYPEHNYISIDCYTCGNEGKPSKAIQYILDNVNYEKYKNKEILRG